MNKKKVIYLERSLMNRVGWMGEQKMQSTKAPSKKETTKF